MAAEPDVSERLGFLQLDHDAIKALQEIAPLVKQALPGILADFYVHMRKWPQVSGHFSGEPMMDKAKNKQIAHWGIILQGDFSADYVNSVRRIGKVHARIGLEPRWYIAGYSFIATRVSALIAAHCHAKVFGRGAKWQSKSSAEAHLQAMVTRYNGAFLRAAMLDMDFAISIYLEEGKLAKQKAVREIATAFEFSVGGIAHTVAAAATELEHTGRSMSSIAEATSSKAVVMSTAAEQATTSVSTVANSTDELNQAVAEISRQVGQASRITATAVVRARSTNETMVQLSAAADKIGQVISLIYDIAGQTNLLVLNATIERPCWRSWSRLCRGGRRGQGARRTDRKYVPAAPATRPSKARECCDYWRAINARRHDHATNVQ